MNSRWKTNFESHSFVANWAAVMENLNSIKNIDPAQFAVAIELGRLDKVANFVDRCLARIDPDFLPFSVLDNLGDQAKNCLEKLEAYKQTGKINQIRAANDHVDFIFSALRIYQIDPIEDFDASSQSYAAYTSRITSEYSNFQKFADEKIRIIEERRASAEHASMIINDASIRCEQLMEKLFVDSESRCSLSTLIENRTAHVDELYKKIKFLYEELLVGDASKASLSTEISFAKSSIDDTKVRIDELILGVQQEVSELKLFHQRIFGDESGATTAVVKGLKRELDERLAQLEDFEELQKKKHTAIFLEIESLLPGATSAGLASAYKNLKVSFEDPIKKYTTYYYVSLSAIAIGALIFSVKSLQIWPFSVEFNSISTWDEMLRSFVGKLGYIIPVVSMAIFSSNRRTQYERLKQEYAHKEALASSYDSYKKQIMDLQGDSSQLQAALLSCAIETISHNASATLDKPIKENNFPQEKLFKFNNLGIRPNTSSNLAGDQ